MPSIQLKLLVGDKIPSLDKMVSQGFNYHYATAVSTVASSFSLCFDKLMAGRTQSFDPNNRDVKL